MVFGHNTNIKFGATTFHVQTEDRGDTHALIDTTVYYQGRVLHRRTNNYFDLLPLNEDSQQALKLRLDEQHRTVLDEIRRGELQLAIPSGAAAAKPVETFADEEKPAAIVESHSVEDHPRKLALELVNARSWLAGKHATLHVCVREEDGAPVQGAHVLAEIEGSAGHPPYGSQTGEDGEATIFFEMPKLTGAEAALVIRAEEKKGSGQLRFALRAKPRVPAQ